MKLNAVTIEKIQNILEQNKTTIETKVENDKLYLRNINWETIKHVKLNIKQNLTPLEEIQSKKNPKKMYYGNYVHMQNNYYYNFTPPFMPPRMMGLDPNLAQQMAYAQMNMFGNYQQQNPYPGFMPQQFQQNEPNNN